MRPGPKPKGQVMIKWSSDFAYAIGLFTADGCLQKNGRHLDFTSADRSQIETFKRCLGLCTKIGIKYSSNGDPAFRVQFGDVLFHQYLQSIGLHPAKSKTITHVNVPERFFRDFLRGLFDGDGSSYDYYDSTYKNSFRFYVSYASASPTFAKWLQGKVRNFLPVTGYISRTYKSDYYQLKFSKRDAQLVAKFMYWKPSVPYLRRKYLKIQRARRIIKRGRSGEIGKHATFRS